MSSNRDCSCNPHTYAWEIHVKHTCDLLHSGPGIEHVDCGIKGPSGIPEYITNVITYEGNGHEYIKVNPQGDFQFTDEAIIWQKSVLADGSADDVVKEYRIEATGVLTDGQEQQMCVHIMFIMIVMGSLF